MAILNLVGFWVIGTVVGASLCFAAGLGVAGLWWGLAIGLTATATVGLGCLSQTNFKHEAHLATQRIQSSCHVCFLVEFRLAQAPESYGSGGR